MNQPKLTVELVPATSWMNNLRAVLTTSSWDKLRKESYKKANHHCEICGGQGVFGRGHKVECHEIWSYDDKNHIQKLEGLISLCTICHRVKHFGLSSLRGYEEQCLKQLMKVNIWQRYEAQRHVSEAFQQHSQRSNHDWELDLSWLEGKEIKFKKKYTIAF